MVTLPDKHMFYTRGNQLRELLKRLARAHNIFYIFSLKKQPTIKLKATQTEYFYAKFFQK
jgi:hypothetical protein